MAEGRKALHAYVSDEAHEQWHEAALTWGVSVSALLEALAPELDDVDAMLSDRKTNSDRKTSSDRKTNIVTTSRRIDSARRRRRRS